MNIKSYKTKKKVMAILCSVLLLAEFAFNSFPVSAEVVTPAVTYSVTGTPTVGSTISIAVNVSNVSSLYGGSVDFKYDPTLLQVNSIAMGSLFSSELTAPTIAPTLVSGQASIGMSLSGSATPIAGSGTLAVITAKVLKVGTVNLKTTNNFSSLSLTGPTVCVKLADSSAASVDGKMAYGFTDSSIATSAYTYKTVEEDNSLINYTGTWVNDSSTAYSGGKTKYSLTAGSSMSFSFTGKGIQLLSSLAPNRGIAKVTIDGTAYNVDLYSSSSKAKAIAFELLNLASGTHTAKVEFTGTKNTSATSNLILIDGFNIADGDIISSYIYKSVEEDNSLINYTGTWINDSSAAYSSSKAKYSLTSGSSMSFSFTGKGIQLLSSLAPNRGIAKVTIDGTAYNVDLYSSSSKAKAIAFELLNLASGTHTAKVEFTGTKNTSATSNLILIDGFNIADGDIISSYIYKSVEEDNSLINYTGTWINDSSVAYSSSKAKYSLTSGSSLSFSFTGKGIQLLSSLAPNRGIAKVTIDGTAYNVDLYSSSAKAKAIAFELFNLASGTHTAKVEFTGAKNASATSNLILIDGFNIADGDIISSVAYKAVEEDNSLMSYTGTWAIDSNAAYSGSKAKYSQTAGSSMSFSFTGTGIQLMSSLAPNRGIAKVTIDGTAYNVDLYSSSAKAKAIAFELSSLTSGTHTAKIEYTGTKNPSATSNLILIDGFNIANGDIVSSSTSKSVEEDNSLMSYTGNWAIDSNSAYSGSKAKYSQTAGSSMSFSFTGTGIQLLSCTAPNRGIAKVTIDGTAYNVDLYSSDIKSKAIAFELSSLTSGTHTAKVEFTGTKNTSATSNLILIDAFNIANGDIVSSSTYKSVEEDNSLMSYTGTWAIDSNAAYSGSKAKYSQTAGSSISFSFTGTGIQLMSSLAPNRGIAKVTIDGTAYNVDLYSSSVKAKAIAFELLTLTSGTHTAKVEFTGTKNTSATSNLILIDAFNIANGDIVSSSTYKSVEEDNSLMSYTGTWAIDSNAAYSGSKAKYSQTAGSSISFSFTGTGIQLMSTLAPNRGIAKVTIDGTAYNVDLYSSSVKAKAIAFELLTLTSGTHTAKVEFTGTKNASATSNLILIDAFNIANGDIV